MDIHSVPLVLAPEYFPLRMDVVAVVVDLAARAMVIGVAMFVWTKIKLKSTGFNATRLCSICWLTPGRYRMHCRHWLRYGRSWCAWLMCACYILPT